MVMKSARSGKLPPIKETKEIMKLIQGDEEKQMSEVATLIGQHGEGEGYVEREVRTSDPRTYENLRYHGDYIVLVELSQVN